MLKEVLCVISVISLSLNNAFDLCFFKVCHGLLREFCCSSLTIYSVHAIPLLTPDCRVSPPIRSAFLTRKEKKTSTARNKMISSQKRNLNRLYLQPPHLLPVLSKLYLLVRILICQQLSSIYQS